MTRKDIKIRSSQGGEFDCYLVTPDGAGRVPAIVLASAVHGVDKDIRAIADEFASGPTVALHTPLASLVIGQRPGWVALISTSACAASGASSWKVTRRSG